jgi:hypothetical protein
MTKPKTPLHRRACRLSLLSALAFSVCAEAHGAGCGEFGESQRFAAFHDNYLLWNQMSNNGWTQRDERALRGQVSVKYSIANCPQRREKDSRALEEVHADPAASIWQRLTGIELFVSYTNRFDFYLGSRDSGPVINRISNPGLHLRLPPGFFTGDPGNRRDTWQLSFEHMSDGQVVEPVTNADDQQRAQRAYERGDHRFFDTISRGMNYVAAQGEWVWALSKDETDPKGAKVDLRAKVKAYVGRSDSAITWGPLAGQGLKFADYERVKVRVGLYWPGLGRFELTSQLGDRGFKHASHTLGWQRNIRLDTLNFELPLFVQVHRGPMNTLSNYTQRQDSVGIGLRMAY